MKNKAFTLIEMLVSLALFSSVAIVGAGALLTVIDANSKAQATQSVMNNLNIAIDGMMRAVRMGTNYRCGSIASGDPVDCANPENRFSFITHEGNLQAYYLHNNRIYRRSCSNGTSGCVDLPVTASDIDITRFDVYVAGASLTYSSTPSDIIQPVAVFIIEGTAASDRLSDVIYGKKKKIRTDFKVQTVATQRLLDL